MDRNGVSAAGDVRAQTDLRLKPEMASRRLLVLAFVRDYIAQWGSSPSYGEIANGVGISPTRARQLVKALTMSGQLLRVPGPRGLLLPTVRDEAVRQLRALGYRVEEAADTGSLPCSQSARPTLPMLDYIPPGLARSEGAECQ